MLPSRRSWVISHQCGHKWLWWTGKKPLIYAYSDLILSYGKIDNKTCNLFRNIAAKRVAMFTLYLPRSNLSFSKSGCGRLPEYWLLIGWNCAGFAPYMGITSLAVKQVRLGSVKRATCTDFVAKSRTTFDFRQQVCATCDNLICYKKGLNVGGKTRKMVFQLVLL